MQAQMGGITATNQAITRSCEEWERSCEQLSTQVSHERSLHAQKVEMISQMNLEKQENLRAKLQEKDELMSETATLLEREQDFRTHVEQRRQNMTDAAVEAPDWLREI